MKILHYQFGHDMHGHYMKWKEGKASGQQLWGSTHFVDHGIDVEIMPICKCFKKLKLRNPNLHTKIVSFIYNLKLLVSCKKYDLIYAPYNGLNLIIFFKGLGLFRTKIVIWQHRPLDYIKSPLKKFLYRFIFKSVDGVFYFSKFFYEESLKSGILKKEQVHYVQWGTDVDFYSTLNPALCDNKDIYFSHTGNDNRDYKTLIEAFSNTQARLKILSAKHLSILRNTDSNIEVEYLPFTSDSSYYSALVTAASDVITICLHEPNSAAGISSIMEALGMGKPIIITRNKYHDFDDLIQTENFGFVIESGNIAEWKRCIAFFAENPDKVVEMGKNAYSTAINRYNLKRFSSEVSEILFKIVISN